MWKAKYLRNISSILSFLKIYQQSIPHFSKVEKAPKTTLKKKADLKTLRHKKLVLMDLLKKDRPQRFCLQFLKKR